MRLNRGQLSETGCFRENQAEKSAPPDQLDPDSATPRPDPKPGRPECLRIFLMEEKLFSNQGSPDNGVLFP
jgi:hypothetical protein